MTAHSHSRNAVASVTESEPIVLGSSDRSIADKPLEAYRTELLDLAYETASALPDTPFIKDRARLQETIVEACFQLDQPDRALRYAERIANWRRGACHADFAFYCARHGDSADAKRHMEIARDIANSASKNEDSQDWEIDEIKVRIARTLAVLGQTSNAAEWAAGVVDSEFGKVDAATTAVATSETFDRLIETLDVCAKSGNSDRLRNTLETCVQLFGRFYDDAERRSRMETRIKASFTSLPTLIRVETLMNLSEIAAEHRDTAMAFELLKDARATLDGGRWAPEDRIPLLARQAVLRYRAGDASSARRELDAAVAMFESEHEKMPNLLRAGVLRPIAEAYQVIGDEGTALNVYARAVDEGADNPNHIPRTNDLTATCCSMALHGVEPYGSLKLRMREICDGLSQSR